MKILIRNFKVIVLFLLSFAYGKAQSQLYNGVCRKAYAAGFEKEANVAHTCIGENTSKIAESKVYITEKKGSIYAHSNYIVPGYDFEYPSKLATSEEIQLDGIFLNLYYAEEPTNSIKTMEAFNIFKNKVEVILDPKVIESEKFNSISFDKIKNLKIKCPDNLNREAIIIKNKEGYKEYLIRYNEQILTRIKRQNLTYLFSKIKNEKFDFGNLKILSLIDNKATQLELAANFKDETILFAEKNFENFKSLLLQNKNKQVIILGHIEDGNFITLDNAGKEAFKISIDEIEKIKAENNLNIIILGCNSATNGAKSGAMNTFNSIDFLKSLGGTKNATTTEDFLNKLSDGNFDFLLDETYFRNETSSSDELGNVVVEKKSFTVHRKQKSNSEKLDLPPLGNIIFLSSQNTENNSLSVNATNSSDTTASSITDDTTNKNDEEGPSTFQYILIIGAGILIVRYIYKKITS